MLQMIFDYLPYLGIAITFNLATGLYNNLAVVKEQFSWKKFFTGILVKAPLVSYSFIAFALIYDKLFGVVEVGNIEVAPDALLISVIVLYTVKATRNLMSIFKITNEDVVTLEDKNFIIPRGDE